MLILIFCGTEIRSRLSLFKFMALKLITDVLRVLVSLHCYYFQFIKVEYFAYYSASSA
jgi:hypothetical protein